MVWKFCFLIFYIIERSCSFCLINDLDLKCFGDTLIWGDSMKTWNGRSILLINSSVENFNCSLWPRKVQTVTIISSSTNKSVNTMCKCLVGKTAHITILGCKNTVTRGLDEKSISYLILNDGGTIGVLFGGSVGTLIMTFMSVVFACRFCYRRNKYCRYFWDRYGSSYRLWRFCNRETIRRDAEYAREMANISLPIDTLNFRFGDRNFKGKKVFHNMRTS